MARSVFSQHYDVAISVLKAARLKADLHQTDLAARLGRPQSFISKIERRERRIDLVEFLILARAIGVDEIDLVRAVADKLPKDAAL